ncbi:MAG: HAD family hydrolase [Paracoccaceae bacterium]
MIPPFTNITCIGFDADDTLWHSETFFKVTQAQFYSLLADFIDRETLEVRLLAAEKRNIGHYGFGIKGFILSMLETAIEVTSAQISAKVIWVIMEAGREMLSHPIKLLPHAREAVISAARHHRIVLVTKGDLLDQERKLAQSGIGDLFHGVEIVSAKTPKIYKAIFTRHGDGPERGLMLGNSMKSDVLPMIACGGVGVFVPHGVAWALEEAKAPLNKERYFELHDIGQLKALLDDLG